MLESSEEETEGKRSKVTVTRNVDFTDQDYARSPDGIPGKKRGFKEVSATSEGMLNFPLKHGNLKSLFQVHDSMTL